MAQKWRIVTYNTWKCEGLYRDRLDWMGQGLQALAPDILCLQEAFDCPERGVDTARHLSDLLGMGAEVLLARRKSRQFEQDCRISRSNLAILSKRQTSRGQDIKLPEHEEDRDRWAMQVTVSVRPGLRLRIINTHLSHLKGEAGTALRRAQAERLSHLCQADETETVVLCGDFNDQWESPSLAPLRQIDWWSAEVEQEGGTFIGARAGVYAASRRIDQVQVTTRSERYVKLVHRFPALNMPIGPEQEHPSDHAALVVDLEFDEMPNGVL